MRGLTNSWKFIRYVTERQVAPSIILVLDTALLDCRYFPCSVNLEPVGELYEISILKLLQWSVFCHCNTF
jgi:hypothetical protein